MNPKKIINWGVIGSGGIARRRTIPEGIAPASHANLAAVFDIDHKVNYDVSQDFKAFAAKSVDDLLNYDIDAVYIASPISAHLEQVIACARAGKHILCEKPLGLRPEDASQMIKVCEANGVLLGTGLMMRFHSQHQLAKLYIEQGKLGKPVYARAQLSCWYPPIEGAWRQDPETGGGGSLMDMGSHCIDLLEMLFGPIKSLSCYINNTIHSYKSEDSAIVSLFFQNGALGTVDTFFCIPDNSSKNVLELYGSRGSILAKGTIGQGDKGEMLAFLEKESAGYDGLQTRESGEGIVMIPEPKNTYLAEIEEFSSAILQGRKPKNSADIGYRSQKIMQACYESARTGKTIEF